MDHYFSCMLQCSHSLLTLTLTFRVAVHTLVSGTAYSSKLCSIVDKVRPLSMHSILLLMCTGLALPPPSPPSSSNLLLLRPRLLQPLPPPWFPPPSHTEKQ